MAKAAAIASTAGTPPAPWLPHPGRSLGGRIEYQAKDHADGDDRGGCVLSRKGLGISAERQPTGA
jgi:hypothetical protein